MIKLPSFTNNKIKEMKGKKKKRMAATLNNKGKSVTRVVHSNSRLENLRHYRPELVKTFKSTKGNAVQIVVNTILCPNKNIE